MNLILKEKGQTLIEILVAMGTAVVIISAITVAVISSLYNAQYSKNQNLASQYAQQGMEIMRKIRDSGWNDFYNLSGSYCLGMDQTTLTEIDIKSPIYPGCASGGNSNGQNVDKFAREVDIGENLSSCKNVSVTVFWSDSKCTSTDVDKVFCHSVKLVSCFSDFTVAPSP